MNIIKFNNSQVKLTDKQRVLYLFIVDKLEKNEAITFDEAKEMYIKNSCQNVIDGVPHYDIWCEGDDGVCRTKTFPMFEYEIKTKTVNYITRGIGVLVLKGALSVTPQLKFN